MPPAAAAKRPSRSKSPPAAPEESHLTAATLAEMDDFTKILYYGDWGCLSGSSEVRVNRGGGGRKFRLSTVAERFHNTWDPLTPTFVQCEREGHIRLTELVEAWCSGVKDTFTVKAGGFQIRATAEHKFMTPEGWVPLGDLEPGDPIHIVGPRGSGGEKRPKRIYPQMVAPNHPYRTAQGLRPLHVLVAEAELNNLGWWEFLRALQAGEEGLQFLDPTIWHVHHRDEDPANFLPENLQVMTQREHLTHHLGKGGAVSGTHQAVTVPLESVAYWGEEMTYDLSVKEENHSFVADGFVVHNTAKTTDLAHMAKGGKVIWVNAEGGIKRRPLQHVFNLPLENIELYPDPRRNNRVSLRMLDDLFWQTLERLENEPGSIYGVVFDSVTDIYKVLLEDVREKEMQKVLAKAEAQGTVAEVDPFFNDRGYYGVMTEQMRQIIRRFRDLPCHFGMSALTRQDMDEDSGEIIYGPALNPALQTDLLGWVDLVCRTYTEDPDDGGDDLYFGSFHIEGIRVAKDRYKTMPKKMVTPTFDRIQSYLNGELTAENDPLVQQVRERKAAIKSARRAAREQRQQASAERRQSKTTKEGDR